MSAACSTTRCARRAPCAPCRAHSRSWRAYAQVGVELVERTGRSPHYVYQSLGCSKAAVNRMLRYAKLQCVGKPFSNTGMARSLLWPRQTDGTSFFCAGTLAG